MNGSKQCRENFTLYWKQALGVQTEEGGSVISDPNDI